MEAKFFSEIEKKMDVKILRDFEKEVRTKIIYELEGLKKTNDNLSRILTTGECKLWGNIRNKKIILFKNVMSLNTRNN